MAVQLTYKGTIEIFDKTPNNFAIAAKNNKMVIFPIGGGTLSELFDYNGELEIKTVLVSNIRGEKVPTTIKKVMDYSELMDSNSEDITIKSENIRASKISGEKVSRTILRKKTIKNLHTSNVGTLYLKDGSIYEGEFHIHLGNGASMTGARHTKDSQNLYIKRKNNLIDTKNAKIKKRTTGTRSASGTGGY